MKDRSFAVDWNLSCRSEVAAERWSPLARRRLHCRPLVAVSTWIHHYFPFAVYARRRLRPLLLTELLLRHPCGLLCAPE